MKRACKACVGKQTRARQAPDGDGATRAVPRRREGPGWVSGDARLHAHAFCDPRRLLRRLRHSGTKLETGEAAATPPSLVLASRVGTTARTSRGTRQDRRLVTPGAAASGPQPAQFGPRPQPVSGDVAGCRIREVSSGERGQCAEHAEHPTVGDTVPTARHPRPRWQRC